MHQTMTDVSNTPVMQTDQEILTPIMPYRQNAVCDWFDTPDSLPQHILDISNATTTGNPGING